MSRNISHGTCKSRELILSYYQPQRSCGQGNIFTRVCHSFCSQGGSASVHAGILPPPTRQTTTTPPTRQTTPPDQADPRSRHPPDQADTPRTRQTPPQTRQTPPSKTRQTPPQTRQTSAYGQRAAGTHPTGMHSC